jgi:hypothetical protein
MAYTSHRIILTLSNGIEESVEIDFRDSIGSPREDVFIESVRLDRDRAGIPHEAGGGMTVLRCPTCKCFETAHECKGVT